MVYIKSLICEGFKSFKERTKVNFSNGFTSIVGANGSGKSNILDAFVFALGELSGNKLRVNNIKDLICNGGSQGGKPSKWARVDIVFDNSDRRIPVDSNTVKVSRKININGQGKYYINDKITTRRELQDIMDISGLIPNSSNLILQGELFRIINMNNSERRGLIEEISGIASYNEKKEKAEKDLLKVEENISRITLLLNEVSIQLDSLEKEKNDALKYQDYVKKQKDAEKSILFLKIQGYEKQLEKIVLKKVRLTSEIEEINNKIVQNRENLMKVSTELDQINREIKTLQSSELQELTRKLNELKTEITKKETKIENKHRELTRLKKAMIDLLKKKESIQKKKESLTELLKSTKLKKSKIKDLLETLKEELYHSEEQVEVFDAEYANFQKELEEIKIEISKKLEIKSERTSRVNVLRNKRENLSKRDTINKDKIQKIKNSIQTLEQELQILTKKEKEIKKKKDRELDIEKLEKRKRELNATLQILRKQIDDKQANLYDLRSKINAVKRFSNTKAVEAILSLKNSPEKKQINGKIYGTIGDLGMSNPEYNTALQVAGGGRFNYIVVDHQETAKQCIQYLKKNKIGRASFIPLSKIRINPLKINLETKDKIIGRAVDLIHFDPLFSKAFEYVFGRSVVVADIDTASKLDINAKRITLEGDVVESSNLMTGGLNKKARQGGFSSIEETKLPLLENELSNLKNQEKNDIHELKQIERNITVSYKNRISGNKELSELREKIAIIKANLENKQHELEEFGSETSEIERELKQISNQIEKAEEQLEKIDQEINSWKKRESQIRQKISLLKDNDFTNKISNLRKDIDCSEKKKMKLDLEITRIETQLEQIQNSQAMEIEEAIENTNKDLKSYTKEQENLKYELERLRNRTKELEAEFREKNQIIADYYNKKEEVLKQQTALKVEIEDLKSNIHPKRIKINTLEINKNNIETQKEELEKQLDVKEEEIEKISEFLKLSQKDLSEIIDNCIKIKAQLEPVNMRAIKKYDKIKNRYDDLINKHEIVIEERIAIKEFIEKVELEKKKTFMNTFNGINNHFKNIFAKLSPEGDAKLALENEEDPFAGGIKMLARPGGKRMTTTQSLSGGEKTLTVIALVLGIQMYVPSPYYILDEIDAALDDYNASQVASIIKELSKQSQFILITHRDVTMTKTDQLLGVSNIHGITSVLNLNINEALEQIAQLQN
ncbi:MAG: chromosome segregation protein SMC [Promethearchaeota archaeon]